MSQVAVRPPDCGAGEGKIHDLGGSFSVPTCDGTTGKLTYPVNNALRHIDMTLQPSVTNPLPSVCGSVSGETTNGYLLLSISGSEDVRFDSTARNSELKNTLYAGKHYTLYAFVSQIGEVFTEDLGTANKKGLLKFASPLNSLTMPAFAYFCFELDAP